MRYVLYLKDEKEKIQRFIMSRLIELPLFLQGMHNIENNNSKFSQGICYIKPIYFTFLITFLMTILPLSIYPNRPS